MNWTKEELDTVLKANPALSIAGEKAIQQASSLSEEPESSMATKFHSQRTGHYQSKREAKYAAELELRKQAGEVLWWLEQVSFVLTGGVKYRLDFLVFLANGKVECVDVKGFRTEVYKNKKKQVEALYPIKITEV